MKQKNYSWLVYSVITLLLAGVLYVAFQDITPATHHIEKEAKITFEK